MTPTKKNHYDLLEVSPAATPEEIAFAYRRGLERLAREDVKDESAIAAFRNAYQVLSSADARAAYDARLPAAVRNALPPGVVYEEEPESFAAALFASRWFRIAALPVLLAAAVWWYKGKTAPPPLARTPAVRQLEVQAPGAAAAPASQPAAGLPAGAQRSAEELFAAVSGSVGLVSAFDASGRLAATGSGVVIERDALITNCHVVADAAAVNVKVGGETFPASVDVADEEFDLCKLRVTGLNGKAVAVGSVGGVRPGQKVFAIGAPRGLELTLSDGIVSSLRSVPGGTLIQTTAPTSPGSSGGGLFDAWGKLIGIVTFQNTGGQNLNFAIPADWIGEMRSRTRVSAASGPAAETQPGRDLTPRELIVGKWFCFGSISGHNGMYGFRSDGQMAFTADGRIYEGRYTLQDRTVTFQFGREPQRLDAEEITAAKMILKTPAEGQRLVCEKRD